MRDLHILSQKTYIDVVELHRAVLEDAVICRVCSGNLGCLRNRPMRPPMMGLNVFPSLHRGTSNVHEVRVGSKKLADASMSWRKLFRTRQRPSERPPHRQTRQAHRSKENTLTPPRALENSTIGSSLQTSRLCIHVGSIKRLTENKSVNKRDIVDRSTARSESQ